MNITALRRFVAVADADLHFPRAADALGIPLASLYTSIEKLDDEVGHPLSAKQGAGWQLTPAGVLLAEVRERIAAASAATTPPVRGGGKAKASKGKGRAPIVKGQPCSYKKLPGAAERVGAPPRVSDGARAIAPAADRGLRTARQRPRSLPRAVAGRAPRCAPDARAPHRWPSRRAQRRATTAEGAKNTATPSRGEWRGRPSRARCPIAGPTGRRRARCQREGERPPPTAG
ncbi:MAG: LysR family transcriptional regulator [Microbacterium sp.]